MALTPAQRSSCFEMLSAFWNGATATVTNGFGITLSLSDLNVLTTDINTRLDTVDADVTASAKVIDLVTKWDCVSTVEVELDGSVGDVSGVKYSSSAARERLLKQLHVYVPVLHMLDAIKLRNNQVEKASNSAFFSIGR